MNSKLILKLIRKLTKQAKVFEWNLIKQITKMQTTSIAVDVNINILKATLS